MYIGNSGRRKQKVYLYIFFIFVLMSAVAVAVLFRSSFRVKNRPIYALDVDWRLLENGSFSPDNLAEYAQNNGINTVILPVNKENLSVAEIEGMNTVFSAEKNKDIIRQTKNKLARKKVQLYLSVDCSALSEDAAQSLVGFVTQKYKPAGLVLNNCSFDILVQQNLKNTIEKNSRKTAFVLQTSKNTDISSGIFDTVICEKLNSDQYASIKSSLGTDLNIILHYNSRKFESDSFILTNFHSFDGVVGVKYTGEDTQAVFLAPVIKSAGNFEKFGFEISDKFTVTYPTADFTTYYSGVFVTGCGAENTVNINGIEYPAAADGTFGVYLPLEKGDNPIVVTGKGKTYQFNANKKEYKTSTVVYEKPWDSTEFLATGRVVKTVGRLTSMLSNPDDDSAIIAGLEPGAKLAVSESVQTVRSGYKTYAYRLSNGGYVLASKVEITNEITPDFKPVDGDISSFKMTAQPLITASSIEKLENGDEQLYIAVSGSPAVVHSFTEDKLSVLFLDSDVSGFYLPDSQFYTDYTVRRTSAGIVLDFALNPDYPLWGYDVKSDFGQVRIYLKHTPRLSAGEKPLENITIMLDAGHGGKDSGALGVASVNGPLEKDLNLAVAKATEAILRQYGATVYMTRNDDSFPTLDDRRNLARDIKPDLFISMHHNSMDYSYNSTNARGSECYYFTHQSQNLAQLMCENITNATGRVNRGAFNGYYYVTRTDIAPSVLMEYSFVINPQEFSQTYSDKDIYKAAFGTAMAVMKAIPQ